MSLPGECYNNKQSQQTINSIFCQSYEKNSFTYCWGETSEGVKASSWRATSHFILFIKIKMYLLFCILIMVVVTQIYICVKIYSMGHQKEKRKKSVSLYDTKKTKQVSIARGHQGCRHFQVDNHSILKLSAMLTIPIHYLI